MLPVWQTKFGEKDTSIPEIEGLIKRSILSQWAISDISWNSESPIFDGLNGSALSDLISQAFYAELATIEVCSQLMLSDIGLQAKRFIATQIADETRHAQAYYLYLGKIGGVAEVHPKMNEIFQTVILDKYLPDLCKIIAVNILLEGEAINQQGKRSEVIRCPVFNEINRRILRDEARHNAFGKIFAPVLAAKHTKEELKDIGLWCKGIWSNWTIANRGRYEDPGSQQFRVSETELNGRWPLYEFELANIGIVFD